MGETSEGRVEAGKDAERGLFSVSSGTYLFFGFCETRFDRSKDGPDTREETKNELFFMFSDARFDTQKETKDELFFMFSDKRFNTRRNKEDESCFVFPDTSKARFDTGKDTEDELFSMFSDTGKKRSDTRKDTKDELVFMFYNTIKERLDTRKDTTHKTLFVFPDTREETTARKGAKKNKTGTIHEPNNNIAVKTFQLDELSTATKNFNEDHLLGEGGFGRVYKGKLEETDQVVAVKQLKLDGLQGNGEFQVEVSMLSHLHHPHLVNLIGYCVDKDQRLLVYEYMSAGSLENHLLDLPPGKPPIEWSKRMKVALHTAKAKLAPVGDKPHVPTRVMGTAGYCAAEYQITSKLTVKSDVYSYGVVLLELITGRRAVDLTRKSEELHLVRWAEPRIKDPQKYSELVDPLLQGNYPHADLSQVLAIAAMCLSVDAAVRPSISDVVTALAFLVQDPVQ
ncbi:hypothetical protein L6452_38024 [Arctium lappa]|uniref:Uncharacterized protein n=1 Tax=Arctium lappa TaxID=4217 RepID=A0ACB8Y579_ARCLA|nr:hypothetical protein L6452_38024 [Arctium lappa]